MSKPLHASVDAPAAGTPFALAYLTPAELEAARAVAPDRILGAVAFGAELHGVETSAFPYAWVDMPVLGGGTTIEAWISAAPVVREAVEGLSSARNDAVLFGCLQVEHPGSLDDASYGAYERIFDFIDSRGYPHLLRAWNYFPGINEPVDGLERYRRFCRGRHEAFSAKGRIIGQDTPAASALGTRSGPLTVYFLSAGAPGERVENPRQTSAYHYPAQYGPRSPTFSRGMVMRDDRGARLFISGTAGIVGHETLHRENAVDQARETIENMRAVMTQAGVDPQARSGTLMLKAYVRHAGYGPVIQQCLQQAFGDATKVILLQADICRADLLLEVEGVFFQAAGAAH